MVTVTQLKGVAGLSLFAGIILLVTVPGRLIGGGVTGFVLFYGLFGLFPGVTVMYLGFKLMRRRNLVADTPTSKIQSMAMGLVEVTGTARPAGETFRAPFSDEKCLLYTYTVEEYRQQGKHKSWVTIDEGKRVAPFRVDDGTGTVLVAPEEAQLEIPRDARFEVDGGKEPREAIQRFIEQSEEVDSESANLDLKLFKVPLGNRRRYSQHLLKPGDDVYVFGKAMSDKSGPFIASDASTPLFLISDEKQDDLTSSWTRWSWISIVGGGLWAVGFLAGSLAL